MTTDNATDFVIFEGVSRPERANAGRPAKSQYDFIKQMMPGQAFFRVLKGVEGTATKSRDGTVHEMTAAQDLARKSRQMQSYFSQYAKKNHITLSTRVLGDGEIFGDQYKGQAGIGVWREADAS